LLEDWDEVPPVLITSSEKKIGRDEVLTFIEEALKVYQQQKEEE
jgi:GTP-binding protein